MAIIIFLAGLFVGILLGALVMIFAQLKRSFRGNMYKEKLEDSIVLLPEADVTTTVDADRS